MKRKKKIKKDKPVKQNRAPEPVVVWRLSPQLANAAIDGLRSSRLPANLANNLAGSLQQELQQALMVKPGKGK